MTPYRKKTVETADFLRARLNHAPTIGFLTGTGLSHSLDDLETEAIFNYSDLPNFPASTVKSHTGKLVSGAMGRHHLLVMQGRFHLYEGYTPAEVTFPIRVMQELGIKILILSNAAGGINLSFSPGDIMVITDHINLTGQNPLAGPEEVAWGVRFPDMNRAYDPELVCLARETADACGIKLREGVYAGLLGPSLETPAETRFLKFTGCDAVGFSTVMETIAGVHAGMKILGVSLITNINDPDAPTGTTLEEVIETAGRASGDLNRLFGRLIRRL